MRSYKAARRAHERAQGASEPIPFEVTYFDADDVEHTEAFSAYGEVSSVTITDLAYFSDRGVDTPEGAAIMRSVFEEVIGNEPEFKRFWRVARFVDDDTLVDIMGDLIEATTGRPTERPSGSPASSSTTGQASRVASSPTVIVAEPSEFSD